MPTKLIRLEDGTLVEVEVPDDQAQPISGGFAERVDRSVDIIRPTLVKICRPIIESWAELSEGTQIDHAEVELGLSFEGEGNLYVTKAKASANLTVKLVLKPLPGKPKE
jgi:hypothetical protein